MTKKYKEWREAWLSHTLNPSIPLDIVRIADNIDTGEVLVAPVSPVPPPAFLSEVILPEEGVTVQCWAAQFLPPEGFEEALTEGRLRRIEISEKSRQILKKVWVSWWTGSPADLGGIKHLLGPEVWAGVDDPRGRYVHDMQDRLTEAVPW